MINMGVKLKSIAHVSDDCVRITAVDANGEDQVWTMRVKNYIDFMPAFFTTANAVNKYYSDLPQQTLLAHEVKDFNVGFVTGKDDIGLSLSLEEGLNLHFHFSKEAAEKLFDNLKALYQKLPANKK